MPPETYDPDEVWEDFFSNHRESPGAIRRAVGVLVKRKQFDHVAALIKAAIKHGQVQPWMYEALALALDALDSPRDEIERILLSAADLSGTDADSQMHVAAFLAKWGNPRRALALFRQVAETNPSRSEPYVVGFHLALELNDLDAIRWTTLGILGQVWRGQNAHLISLARDAAKRAIEQLHTQGRHDQADEFAEAVAVAERRDLVIRVTWDGEADVDLIVEEPAGTVCSFQNPLTPAGGVLLGDGYGTNREELYVCAHALPGRYRIKLRRLWGDLVGSQVRVQITRNQGSEQATEEHRTVTLGNQDELIPLTLETGRRRELLEGDFNKARHSSSRRNAQGAMARRRVRSIPAQNTVAIGFQPIIVPFPEGTALSARAIISADRRYVRIGVSPVFSDILGFTTVTQSAGVVGGGIF